MQNTPFGNGDLVKLETKLIFGASDFDQVLTKGWEMVEEMGYLVVLVLYHKTAIKLQRNTICSCF